MNRRGFLRGLGAIIAAAAAPTIFIPSSPIGWKRAKNGLLTYDYDIRQILMENSLKDIAAEIDAKFIEMTIAIVPMGTITQSPPPITQCRYEFKKMQFPVFTKFRTLDFGNA